VPVFAVRATQKAPEQGLWQEESSDALEHDGLVLR
jgi:hypothetical protein